MNNSTSSKLSPGFAWLFALLSLVVGAGLSFAFKGLGSKAMGGAYFASLVVGGFLATYMTRAKTGGAVLAFLTLAGGAAAAYYLVIAKLFSTVAEAAPTAGSAADVAATKAFEAVGNGIGIFVAVIVFFATFIPGTIGASVGSSVRGKTGMEAAGAMAKSLAA
ncbi:MAG TPA: hypothetical protein VGM90_25955 [Kofleriaceae bacterium]|jgi:mannose/fructose/N-acetylgalactosamine-specific phosphotransferase system component IIC